ncbi:MAG: CDP-diacylglycerol--glycerol-3-phosphate 3-phosphatidyltransferase [Bacilli bacterium]
MKKMNLPNKITVVRIVLAIVILVMLVFPWYELNLSFPIFSLMGVENVDLKYIIAGVLFLIASVTDFLDGYIARSQNLVTDFGKVMDAIADKILVNGLLIILAYNNFISIIVPVVIITRDIVVDSIKMVSGSKGKVVAASWPGKIKTICMMIGLTLVLFYNIPFAFFGIRVDQLFVFAATILSVISGCQYYMANKDFIFNEM